MVKSRANTVRTPVHANVAPGPVAKTVPMMTIADGIVDLGFDGSNLWGIDGVFDDVHYIDKIDSQTGNVLSHFQAPNQSTIADGSVSLAFANSYMWVLNYMDNVIYKVDPTTGNKISAISASSTDVVTGLGFDGTYLWYGVWDYYGTNGGALLRKINTSGTLIDSFHLADVMLAYDIEFVNGELWATGVDFDYNPYLYRINTSNKTITNTYDVADCENGLAFDGTYLWTADWCDYEYTAYQVSTPPPPPPTVTTNPANSITKNSAVLNGTVNANGAATTVTFDFGLTTSYGASIPATPSPVTGTSNTNVTANKTGLACGATYHYRAKGTNSAGTSYGADKSFTTLTNCIAAPTVVTTAATNITATSVKLNGTINPNGATATISFDFGPTTAYGASIAAAPASVYGTTAVAVAANKTGLTCGTTYHYRAKGVSSAGTGLGADKVFTTSSSCVTRNKSDFVITDLTLIPGTPTTNGTFYLAITVKNQGLRSADGGFIDAWANQTTAPACGADGDAWMEVGTLAAGASKIIILSGLPAGTAGSKTVRAFVDSWCETVESNETNNQLTKVYTVQ